MTNLLAHKKKAGVIATLFLILIVGLATGISNFKIDASSDTLLTDDNALYLHSQTMAQRYNPDDFILIAYQPRDEPALSDTVLTRVANLETKLGKIKGVVSTTSIASVPIFVGMTSFSADINADALSWNNKRYSQDFLSKALKNHPLYEDLLINQKQDTVSIQLVFSDNRELSQRQTDILRLQKKSQQTALTEQEVRSLSDWREQAEKLERRVAEQKRAIITQVYDVLAEYEDTGTFYLGGASLLAYQLIDIIQNDLVIFGIAVTLIITLLLYLLFREIRWVVLPLGCCAVSVMMTLGTLGYLGLKVTVISANVIALQIILTLAMLIHLIVSYRAFENESPNQSDKAESNVDLVTKMLKDKAKPCFYAGITTGIGFGSLMLSGIQPVIDFGMMMVIALGISLMIGLLFFPTLVRLYPTAQQKPKSHVSVFRSFLAFSTGFANKHRWLPFAWLGLSCLSLIGILRLETDNSFINYFRTSTPTYQQLSFIDQEFGGSVPLDIIYTIPDSEKKKDLEISADTFFKLKALNNGLAEFNVVGSVTSAADFSRIASEVAGKPLTEYEINALYHTLDEKLKAKIFAPYYSQVHEQLRIGMRLKDSTDHFDRKAFLAELRALTDDIDMAESNTEFSGVFILYEDILSRLVNSQIQTLALVYVIMAILLWGLFKSLRMALIALAPNVATTALLFGFMGLLSVPLDLMTMTIAAVAMGISVDDTIHYIHRYQQAARDSDSPLEDTNHSVGYALIYTTTIIVIGFGALVFSDFMPSVYFGLLAALAMVIALLADLTLLPALLEKYVKKA